MYKGLVRHIINDWSYDDCGKWKNYYEKAKGKHQSPINIITKDTIINEKFQLENPLLIDYDVTCCFDIKNNGHTFQVDCCQLSTASKIF